MDYSVSSGSGTGRRSRRLLSIKNDLTRSHYILFFSPVLASLVQLYLRGNGYLPMALDPLFCFKTLDLHRAVENVVGLTSV